MSPSLPAGTFSAAASQRVIILRAEKRLFQPAQAQPPPTGSRPSRATHPGPHGGTACSRPLGSFIRYSWHVSRKHHAAMANPTKDPKGRMHTFCHAVPGVWHVMGVTQSAGLSLRWLKETFSQVRIMTR